MPTLFVAGASRGIGLELAKQYLSEGWKVHATYRTPGSHLEQLHGDIHLHQLDLTDHDAIMQLRQTLNKEPIDILFHNAGIYGHITDENEWLESFRVNTIAPFQLISAFAENVGMSKYKIATAMSSKMGSMSDNGSGGSYVYRSSKAALNAVMKSFSIDLAQKYAVTVIIMHPGWVETDMTGPGALISTTECVTGIRNVLNRITPADAGRFYDYAGKEILW
ncbi:hypothetical protein MNBD_GAMMA16-13 [hydrothermal vent metagenome]|uniref:Short-chain dehydrogenase n=1 Tax=hydrothermal vent metagenome TaxID=652676 RepID=A0A3B1A2P1_9ZZZZ